MPNHPYYEPSNEFIERHGLHIDEAERWCEFFRKKRPDDIGPNSISYDKKTGQITLHIATGSGFDESREVFDGYLPNEAALESVIKWTNW